MACDKGVAFVVDNYAECGAEGFVRWRPPFRGQCLYGSGLVSGVVESVWESRGFVEVDELDATVFIAGVAGAVCGVEGET